jgi:hypothetical protein
MQLDATIRNAGGDLGARGGAIDSHSYGHLFRDLRLAPWQPIGPGDPRDAIYAISEDLYGDSPPNPSIPAGYSFFGQFLTHDLTFAISPFGPAHNQRTPRFDLDSVYGSGPASDPHLYELRNAGRFLIGRNATGEPDLPRNADKTVDSSTTGTFDRRRRALIGDPRNDENTILSQLHLAFLYLHNRFVAEYDFETSRTFVRWSYQHVVIRFLRLLCGDAVVDDVLRADGTLGLRYFKIGPGSRVYMPVEFSFAALRVGHSMLGPTSHLSSELERERGGHPFLLFADTANDWNTRNRWSHGTLEGVRELPKRWSIQWDRFVSPGAQESRLIDTKLTPALRRLPIDVSPGARDERERSLAYRTLVSGWYQKLPSGQRIAELLGLEKPLDGNDPLWVYLLREAEETGGRTLGPVGARIVAEVCIGLLCADESSLLYAPARGLESLRGALGLSRADQITLESLLSAAGVPITRTQWKEWVL